MTLSSKIFISNWDSFSKRLIKRIEIIRKEFDIEFVYVDIDREKDLVSKFNVVEIPTIIIFDNDIEISRIVGDNLIKPLRTHFNKVIKDNKDGKNN
jgi:thioredoxin-like negative regulator of GroEL